MKRFVLLLALVVVLIFLLRVAAGNWEIVGEVTQNNMNLKEIETDGDCYLYGNKYYGTGYYTGGRYWVTPRMVVGLGYDRWEGNFHYLNGIFDLDGYNGYYDEYYVIIAGVLGLPGMSTEPIGCLIFYFLKDYAIINE